MKAGRPCPIWVPATSLSSSPTHPLYQSVSFSECLLWLEHAKCSCSASLTWLFPLPAMLFLQVLHGLSSPGGSDSKESTYSVGDLGSISGLGRSTWRRAWQPTPVFLPGESHGQREPGGLRSMEEQKSWTWLSNLARHSTHMAHGLPFWKRLLCVFNAYRNSSMMCLLFNYKDLSLVRIMMWQPSSVLWCSMINWNRRKAAFVCHPLKRINTSPLNETSTTSKCLRNQL